MQLTTEYSTDLDIANLNGLSLISGAKNGTWLDQQEFPELRYSVPGLIPEGLTLFVGPPKAGKSWLLLGTCLSLASGTPALGKLKMAESQIVLYLALEDGNRRMKARCKKITSGPLPGQFYYLTAIRPGMILSTLDQWLTVYPETGLIVIDTLGKVMPQATPGETTYQRDYRVAGELKNVADEHPGLCVVIAHHDRKAASNDFVDSVSGTHGLAGAADTIIVLARKRLSGEAVLKVTGREVEENEYAVSFDSGTWTLDGDDLDQAADVARERQETENLGDQSTSIVRYIGQHPEGSSAGEIDAELHIGAGIYMYLKRLCESGRIDKASRGRYVPLGHC